jgi:hypothetical protein
VAISAVNSHPRFSILTSGWLNPYAERSPMAMGTKRRSVPVLGSIAEEEWKQFLYAAT